MRASQRVMVISAVGEKLAPRGWAIADLILEQFGVVPDDYTDGDVELHIHRSLASVEANVLVELAEHFDVPVQAGVRPDSGELLWRKGEVRVFISHLAVDKVKATSLARAMDPYGITSFVAHEQIHPSLEWQQEIERALRSMDAMVAMVTPDFPKSNWTDQEVGFALGRGLLVIPIQLGLDPYGFFGKHQAVKGSGRKAKDISADVYDALVVNPLTQSRMARPAIDRFAASVSFRQAEANAQLLLRFSRLLPAHLSQIEAACLGNRQISEAAECPALLAELYAKHGHVPTEVPGGWENTDAEVEKF